MPKAAYLPGFVLLFCMVVFCRLPFQPSTSVLFAGGRSLAENMGPPRASLWDGPLCGIINKIKPGLFPTDVSKFNGSSSNVRVGFGEGATGRPVKFFH